MNLSKPKLDALRRRVTLFEGFEIEHISDLLQYGRLRELESGELIISEGTLSTKVYILIAGNAAVSRRVELVDEHIATLTVGSTIGEMGIIDSAPRSARVVAEGKATVLEIDVDGFHALPSPALSMVYRNLSRVLVQRVRGANARIKVLAASLPEHIDLAALILKDGLVGLELDGLRASGISIENGEFKAGVFSECDFTGADFTNSNFAGSDFDGASLNGAVMDNAALQYVTFNGADLTGADFRGANLTNVIFDDPDDDDEEASKAIGEDEEEGEGTDDSLGGVMLSTLTPKS